jgi:hypothetical protein
VTGVELLEDGTPSGGKKKTAKSKQPGVGKGNWTRPAKETTQLQRKAEALAVQNALGGDGIDESESSTRPSRIFASFSLTPRGSWTLGTAS